MAKVPSHKDMDEGMFIQHWLKRHAYEGVFDKTHEKFPDDTQPLWSAIKSLHDRIHAGKTDDFDIPDDHIHLESVSKQLEELL